MDCFGPIGEYLAFFGALGIILVLYGGVFVVMDLMVGNLKNRTIGSLPASFWIMAFGGVLLLLVFIGGFINQAFVPSACAVH